MVFKEGRGIAERSGGGLAFVQRTVRKEMGKEGGLGAFYNLS